ncbi:hypothetical protein JCGZ_22059 [Jatropha curcas]|uniref:Uncharacterized protein n=1 Tax=Jatropha curcas TaxID=180498 RepID=A0A067JSX9_JATCU|nr:hypothetical protein JCGZ_22059 [Jatropha curcas]
MTEQQRMSLPLHRNGHYQNKDLDQDKKQMRIEEHFRGNEPKNKDLEHVYQIDYHGVTTHPIPTPKHPTTP